MRFIIAVLLISFLSFGQTPFEFAVVEELVGGSPFISIIRIEINPGVPEPGRTQLMLTTRAGMEMEGSQDLFPDSSTSTHVVFSGVVEYRAEIPVRTLDRIFSVLSDAMDRFPGTGITDLALDVVDINDLSWISVECDISRIDSVLQGTMTHERFWRTAALSEFEVGTALFPTQMRRPLVPDWTAAADSLPMVIETGCPSARPWKSLLFPGWGQLASGRGIGWLNIAVEAGGIALLVSGEDEAGIAVLGVNHFISFIDLF